MFKIKIDTQNFCGSELQISKCRNYSKKILLIQKRQPKLQIAEIEI